MPDQSKVPGSPEADSLGELAELQRELAARDKTIQVLIARVEGQLARRESSMAVLEQNISLEQRVQRRTRELEQSHENLSRTLLELKLAQAQLLESNKLEAIGQLAAGVAHEINTPVQYVADNTLFLKNAFECLLAALAETDRGTLAADGVSATPRHTGDARPTSAKLDWLGTQIPRAIEQSLEGLERITSIVCAMKEFSHPSEVEMQPTDLHEAIKTTITVARHEWKYVADVRTEFARDLPSVPCLRNEFNQVILNLIINAAHAVAERTRDGADGKGTISIATELVDGEVEVRVRDNGAGIAKEVGPRVYDPFFTTKGVGKGTGQGLSIARSVIVNRHNGSIRFESVLGEGTCFFVRLPLARVAPEATLAKECA